VHIIGAQRLEFVDQKVFQTLRARGKKIAHGSGCRA
jgi:hypothetical protein